MHNFLKNVLLTLGVVGVLASCDSASSDKITIIRNGDGPQVNYGDVVFVNMDFYQSKEQVLYSTNRARRVDFLPCTDTSEYRDGLPELLGKLHVGDSAILKVNARYFYEELAGGAVPPMVVADSNLTFEIRIDSSMSNDEFEAMRKKQMQEQLDYQLNVTAQRARATAANSAELIAQDGATIDAFLSKEGLTSTTTENGIRVVLMEEGTGELPVPGSKVTIDYIGTTLDDELFDTSVQEAAAQYDKVTPGRQYAPFEFQLGVGQVIIGWDEAIATLKVGTRCKIFIPSSLAYGGSSRGDVIGANEILVFELNLIAAESPF